MSPLLGDPDAHPIALDTWMLQEHGPAWLAWEPETIAHVLADAPAGTLAKLHACKTLHLVDTFWQRWEVFGWLTQALAGRVPDFRVLEVPTASLCLVAIDIAHQIRTDVAWSDEVSAYLGAVHKHDGVFVALPPGDFAAIDTTHLPFDPEEVRARWRTVKSPPSGDTVIDEQLRRLFVVQGFLDESRAHLTRQLRSFENGRAHG